MSENKQDIAEKLSQLSDESLHKIAEILVQDNPKRAMAFEFALHTAFIDQAIEEGKLVDISDV